MTDKRNKARSATRPSRPAGKPSASAAKTVRPGKPDAGKAPAAGSKAPKKTPMNIARTHQVEAIKIKTSPETGESGKPSAADKKSRRKTSESVPDAVASAPGKPVDEIEAKIRIIIETGKKNGFLTYEQINDQLPDEAITPARLDSLLMTLDELGVQIHDEGDALKVSEEDFTDTEAVGVEEDELAVKEDEELERVVGESEGRRIDDPVRMYLTQMGEIPLLSREEEISLAKKIELARLAFRRRWNQIAHELGHNPIQVSHLLAAQPQHVLERLFGPAALADIVHNHQPMVRADDQGQQRLDLLYQLFVEGRLRPSDPQLLYQSRQALRKNYLRRFRVLVLVIVKQFGKKRQPLEGALLRPRLVRGGFALLNPLAKSLQVRSLACQQGRLLLAKRFKIIPKRQHDLLRLRTRIQLRIGGHILEEDQGRFTELPDNPLPRHLAFGEAAISPHHSRGKEQFRVAAQRLQQFPFQGRVQLGQFRRCLFERSQQATLRPVQVLEYLGPGQFRFSSPLGQSRQRLADIVVVLDQLRDDPSNIIDRQLADQCGQDYHQLAMRSLPNVNGALQQDPERFVLLFQRPAVRFQLLYAQLQLIVALLDVLHQSYGGRRLVVFIRRNHAHTLLDFEDGFNTGVNMTTRSSTSAAAVATVTRCRASMCCSHSERRSICRSTTPVNSTSSSTRR